MKDLMAFTEAAKLCPSKPSADALSRWRREGIKTRSGELVRLQCLRSGKQYFTSELWLREFFNRIAELDQIAPPTKPMHIASRTHNAHQRLAAEGL